jgi:hypothetical protein
MSTSCHAAFVAVRMRQADVRSIVERLEDPAREAYSDRVMLGVVQRARWSAWRITVAVHRTALGLVTTGGPIPAAMRGRAHMKAVPAECSADACPGQLISRTSCCLCSESVPSQGRGLARKLRGEAKPAGRF